jgi:hypothetical protein
MTNCSAVYSFKRLFCLALILFALPLPGWTWGGKHLLPESESSATGRSNKLTPSNHSHRSNEQPLLLMSQKENLENEAVLLNKIARLKPEDSPLGEQWENRHTLDLHQYLTLALKNSILLKQAKLALDDSKEYARKMGEPNPLNLLKLSEVTHYKKAAEHQVTEAEANQLWAKQSVIFESARLYELLVKAYTTKQTLFNQLKQQQSTLKSNQERFVTGEVTKLAITQAKMALIENYQLYLKACQNYYSASVTLGMQAGETTPTAYEPKHKTSQEQQQLLTAPPDVFEITLEQAMDRFEKRADRMARLSHYDALVELSKASTGIERQKREAVANQYALASQQYDMEKKVVLQTVLSEYQLARQFAVITQQQWLLANEMLQDLEVSYKTGFSSFNNLQDGRLQYQNSANLLEQVKMAQIVKKLHLLLELGLIEENTALITNPDSPASMMNVL